ncbi:xyloglucanase [Pontibacter silvestris]|uniref:Xyloglucanase n=1 Tax=Pontibacter silvestris TaxID=2305183 RepID=A0ABW4WXJ4_9BACT|nr:xyloglucanase [Pontibacter silvestris]MCC9137609.1 xyloglucanase [Pontibacter silvestris]
MMKLYPFLIIQQLLLKKVFSFKKLHVLVQGHKRWLLVLLCLFSLQSSYLKGWAQTTEPYQWKNVQIQGGGFVTGVIYSPTEKDLVYARTDVGGAYRWNATNNNWVPITDHLGRSEQNYTGVLSLATDPSEPKRVYIAAGLYTQSWAGTGAILASIDKGGTWTRTELPIKLGGNEDGRSAGERLQVDPNSGNILYLGSSTDGLWRSIDYGATWSKVNTFPVASSPAGSGGLSFVVFDKSSGTTGSATPTIYVGVLQKESNNLYRSTDAGSTWQAVPNQPTNYMPQQAALATDGILYITYADGPGPNGVTAGAVWKLNTGSNQWTNIDPPAGQGGYAGVSLDRQNPETLLVSTLNRWWPGDEVFRSTDGGETWQVLLNDATWNHSLAPYAASSNPHWIGDVAIDPFDSDNAWFVTGYGVYNTTNLTAADQGTAIEWTFQNQGLEETVPLKLISPPDGAHLLSALGDIDGFKHDDLDISPMAGRLSPNYGTNTSITFAEKQPSIVARTYYDANGNYGSYSTDGGDTWTSFTSYPAGATGGGNITVSADGNTFLWAPGGVAGIYYSTNKGSTWSAASGVTRAGLKPVADRVNSKKFYVYDEEAGSVLLSTDGGRTFTPVASGLVSVPDWQAWAASISPVFGVEGDLWLTNPNSGLYRTTDSGANFTKLTNVQEAVKVGFGKAAAGKAYPAVYIAGKVNNEPGFFRSDDAGATWTRINDEQHQFGGVNDITGDPRVYGRLYVATAGRGIVYGDSRLDCSGVLDGTAYIDDCSQCVGGETGNVPCAVTGIDDEQDFEFSYAPNPFSVAIHLKAAFSFEYSIATLIGAKIMEGKSKGEVTIGASLQPGIYLLTISYMGKVKAFKIIKY